MNDPKPLADSSLPTNGPSPGRHSMRGSQVIAGTVAALVLAAACAPPAAAATSIKPVPDNPSGYQDLRNPDTRDAAEGNYPPKDSPTGESAKWSGVAIAGAGASALVVGLGGLSRRRRSARRQKSSRAAA